MSDAQGAAPAATPAAQPAAAPAGEGQTAATETQAAAPEKTGADVLREAMQASAAAETQAAEPPAEGESTEGAEAGKGETPPEGEGEETEKPDPEAERQQFVRAMAKLEHENTITKKQNKDLTAKVQELTEKAEKMLTDPLGALLDAGWKWDDIVQIQLNDGKLPAEKQLKILQDKIANEEAAKKSEEERAAKEAETQAVTAFKDEIKELVDSQSGEYELLAESQGYELVWNIVEAHYNETGELLTAEAAAQKAEAQLEALVAEKFLKTKKIATRLQSQTGDETPPAPGAKSAETTPAAPTLTNRTTASATPPEPPTEYLDDEASKRHAANVLRQLQSKPAA